MIWCLWNALYATDLISGQSVASIPSPLVTMINSTSLSVTIKKVASLPVGDQWTSSQVYDIVSFKSSDKSSLQTLALSGTPPITKIFTGLEKYTFYTFYLHFFGNIKATAAHNVISAKTEERTAEDGMYLDKLIHSTQQRLLEQSQHQLDTSRK